MFFYNNPYNINYQLPRAILAFGQLIIILFTTQDVYGESILGSYDFFNLLVENKGFGIYFYVFTLLFVISGFLPQLSSILHFYFSMCYMYSSSVIEGGDQIALILCVFFLPICIFDKRLNNWKRSDFYRSFYIQYFVNSTFRVMQIQIAIVYLFAAAVKIKQNEWSSGSAIYYWFYNESFGANEYVKNILASLVNSHIISPFITWSVLVLEFILFLALFMSRSITNYLFYVAVFFHVMIGVVFGLWMFSIIMIACLCILLTPNFMNYETKSV